MYEHHNNIAISRYGETVANFQADFKINNSEFELGKTTYTLNIHAVAGSKVADFDIIYTCDGNTIPAISLFTTGEQDLPDPPGHVTGCLCTGNQDEYGYTISMYKVSNAHILSRSIVENRNDFGANIAVGEGNNTRLIYGKFVPYDGNNTVSMTITADFPVFIDSTSEVVYSGEESQDYRYKAHSFNSAKLITTASGTSNTYMIEIANDDMTHINQAINYYSVTGEIPADQVWSIRSHLKKNGSVVGGSYKAYDFKILPDAKIWLVWTDKTTGDDSPNLILHISDSPWLQKPCNAPDSAYTETSSLDTDYWRGNWQDYDTGDSYTGWCSTNIPIFTSDAKGDAYGRGEIGIDEALNGGDTSFYISTIGDDLSASDIPTVNLSTSGVGCYIYALSASDLKEIMSDYLYTDDATLKAAYVDALWMWGNNPIDFMIDLYYIPFDISSFYDTNNANLKFGTYQIPDTSYPVVIESNGDRITLFETSFEPIYNDWRDYTLFDYDLFLPYMGWFSLDPQKYINKMVRCEMMFDITTHNLRYYIFADDIIIDRVDGSVGINLPLMATDQVNKAKNDRNLKYGALTSAISGGASIGLGLTSKDVGGGISGIVSGISSIINAKKQYEDLNQKASQSVEGAFSSAMNIYDIKYAYLRITERPVLMPDKLNQLYGYPCYYMGKASALSGYCEISDIRLSGFTGTKDEAEALKITLKEGVIL